MGFLNRVDAGRQLASALRGRYGPETAVIGVTSGGVPVAAEVARELAAALDICVARKLVVLRDAPIAIGAIAEGGATYVDPKRLARCGVSSHELADAIDREAAEVRRLSRLLRSAPPLDLRGRGVILVDDGIVTGETTRAAALALTARGVYAIDLAVPCASTQVLDELRPHFDRILCLEPEPDLAAVGARYRDFWPVSEAEIVDLLEAAPLSLGGVPV